MFFSPLSRAPILLWILPPYSICCEFVSATLPAQSVCAHTATILPLDDQVFIHSFMWGEQFACPPSSLLPSPVPPSLSPIHYLMVVYNKQTRKGLDGVTHVIATLAYVWSIDNF